MKKELERKLLAHRAEIIREAGVFDSGADRKAAYKALIESARYGMAPHPHAGPSWASGLRKGLRLEEIGPVTALAVSEA